MPEKEFHKKTRGTQYVYPFIQTELIAILKEWLRNNRYELPHQEETVDEEIVWYENDHIELIVERQQPKNTKTREKLKKFPGPPKQKDPNIIDISNMSAEEILQLALRAEQKGVGKKPKTIPVSRQPISQRNLGPNQLLAQKEEVIAFALKKAKGFTAKQIMDELGIEEPDNTVYSRIRYWLNGLVDDDVLAKKKVPIPGMKKKLHWIFTKRGKR
jgi:hypothetical protein